MMLEEQMELWYEMIVQKGMQQGVRDGKMKRHDKWDYHHVSKQTENR
jgi:hypothetical protein